MRIGKVIEEPALTGVQPFLISTHVWIQETLMSKMS